MELAIQLLKRCGMIRSSEKCQLLGVQAPEHSFAGGDPLQDAFGADLFCRPDRFRTRLFTRAHGSASCATVIAPFLKMPASKRGDLAASNTF
jgi:hypothetical protein